MKLTLTPFLFALAAAAWLAPLHGQAIYKCVGKDGKTSYSNSRCPAAKRIGGAPAASAGAATEAAAADVSLLPSLQHGRWKWEGIDGEACSDPLEKTRRLINTTYAAAARLGCKGQVSAPVPGNAVFIMDCPADRSEGGVSVRKGRLEITVFSPTPLSVRISTREPDRPTEIFAATRLGDC